MKRLSRVFLLAMIFGWALPGAADELRLYRYINTEGNVVIQPSIPPEYVTRGYQVINTKGRVLETVAPARSDAELLQLREAELRLLAEEQEKNQQQQHDAALLATYSQPEDVMKALKRALEEVDARLGVEQGNLSRTQQSKEARQADAARLERGGRAVPDSLSNEIGQYDLQIQRLQKRLDELHQIKQGTRLKYIADQRRLEELRSENQVDSGDWPEELLLEPEQLSGLWRLRFDDGAQQEWVLNPAGTFTSLREDKNGQRQLVLGRWTLVDRELHISVTAQHLTDAKGKTEILSNPPDQKHPVLDFKPKELVLQVGTNVIRLKR